MAAVAADALSAQQRAPPTSTVALLGTFGLVALHLLLADTSPVISLADAGGAVAISPGQLLALRALFACVHCCNIVYTATVPVTINVVYKADLGSLLKPESFRLAGLPRLYTFFTIWSYAAQGVYFALAAGASAAVAHGVGVGLYGARVLYAMQLLFEITAGASILVTVVVTFVIWPELTRDKVVHDNAEIKNLLMHNMNVVEVATELVFGRVPVLAAHAPVGVAWGCLFIGFSWLNAPLLARAATAAGGKSRGNGGNFPYFFLDWTLPRKVQAACLLGLLAVLLAFYFCSIGIRVLLHGAVAMGAPTWLRAAVTYGAVLMLCKFRD